jgi:acetylornithine deacetylase/succinyl-diaminopimelate desuccinylase-like protein
VIERVDVGLLWELFERFVAADTSARIGENRIDPQDERLAGFARDVAAPTLLDLGGDVSVDALNNVVARFGDDTGDELLLVAYPGIHHGNEMDEPLRARRRQHEGEELWAGLGASQSKAGLAAACAAIRTLQEQGIDPAGRVTIAVSSEASSSHTSAESLYRAFDRLPRGAILMMGTENRVTLGNRGRVDVVVEIHGRATHSSAADTGLNPIPFVAEVQRRLEALPLDTTPHPRLGPRALVPYKLVCGPVVPHTIPSSCTLVIDRRFLPGDDPDAIVGEIADAMADLPVAVRQGNTMLPALVEETAAVVVALQDAARATLGRPLETFYPRYTFDAGYSCALGVPTVMCGPSSAEMAGPELLGEDFVAAERVREAAALYAAAVARIRAKPRAQ